MSNSMSRHVGLLLPGRPGGSIIVQGSNQHALCDCPERRETGGPSQGRRLPHDRRGGAVRSAKSLISLPSRYRTQSTASNTYRTARNTYRNASNTYLLTRVAGELI